MERSGAVRKWYLQLDIHNYFMSIDQDILQANTHHLCQALWRDYPFLAQYFDFDPERPFEVRVETLDHRVEIAHGGDQWGGGVIL
jgi:hypothetical protein